MTALTKRYLGDGAYVELEEGSVKLTTEDGIDVTNVVYLGPDELVAFLRWLTTLSTPARDAIKEALNG